jgi:hypothetical protein
MFESDVDCASTCLLGKHEKIRTMTEEHDEPETTTKVETTTEAETVTEAETTAEAETTTTTETKSD